MFISQPSFELAVPNGLRSGPSERYWRMLTVVSPLPWYIATFESVDEGETFMHSMFFCWESDLLSAIETMPATTLLSLQMVQPATGNSTAWSIRSIVRMWRRRNQSPSHEGQFVFEDKAGACFCPFSGSELMPDLSDCEIAAEVQSRQRAC
jgi:hypothetical protein